MSRAFTGCSKWMCAIVIFTFVLTNGNVSFGKRFHWRKKIQCKDTSIQLDATCNENINVHYIGCSGFFISKGRSTILFDPYFSYKVALRRKLISAKKRRSKKLDRTISKVFERAIGSVKDTEGKINALVIDHAHVDHLGDVPYLFKEGYLKRSIKIVGNTTAGSYLRGFDSGLTSILAGVEDSASFWLRPGRWVYLTPEVRIMPIVSEHGPHFKLFGRGVSLASGRHEIDSCRVRHCPLKLGSGQTLSYVVDFLNPDGSINFRMYHCSASMNAPNGFPPSTLIDEHPIDLAILCAASFHQVKNYPEDIIRYLHPRHIIFSHWEDFMLTSFKQGKRHHSKNAVYNYRNLFKRVNRVICDLKQKHGDQIGLDYTIPDVDTRMNFQYHTSCRTR